MNLEEQIAKEVILALSSSEDKLKYVEFFDKYDELSKTKGFNQTLQNVDYQTIRWYIENKELNFPEISICFRCGNLKNLTTPNFLAELQKVIENVTNSYPLNIAQKAVNNVDSSERELISDGFHTFKELYETRLALTASLFNLKEEYLQNKYGIGIISREDYDKFKPYKSKKHSDGELCFGGGWFITGFLTELGQVSFHYEMKDWDLFNIEEVEQAPEWDGHTTQNVINRLKQI